ncbi:hypothetical protein GUH81_21995 [Xanthomonas citri pv. citri]|nr:hypothetical protein [Xanthomonas citri pv. citri]MBD1509397.1 hypothetical protein [Xanthomonas citri pv. citri]MBD1515908.1 hypothetical protein [Xanthomonas citri pv. citri]MBD1520335.1 hypothetical protein [Xanthomonas citri pv. citri]MBD1521813.1 hypothetical protein [Xanthomonas citri pv. citri]
MARQRVKRFLYMPTTNELLDKVKESCSLPSDNVLSQKLGVTRAVISGWRNDRYPIPDERIAQLCAMAKLDGGEWMARIHAERAASPAERALWRSVLDRLSAAAAVVALLVLAVHTGAHEALLAALSPVAVTHPLYIMRNWPRPRTGARPAICTAARAPGRTVPHRQADAVPDGQGLRQAAAR